MKLRPTVSSAAVAASLFQLSSAAVDSGITCRNGCPCLNNQYTWESTSNARQNADGTERTIPDMANCPDPYGNSGGRWCACTDHFVKPDETGNFFKVTQDCEANPIDEATQGEWWKLDEAKTGIKFRGKANSQYHFSPHPMTKRNARNYCKSLGFNEKTVHLHCPNGTNENNWLWWHHPWQPFEARPEYFDAETGQNVTWSPRGLITGITRGRDFDNFDYWCDEDLYPAIDYFNWVWTSPKMMNNNNRVFANHVMVGDSRGSHPGWTDTPICSTNGYTDLDDDGNIIDYKGCESEGPYSIDDGTAGGEYVFHFICEMNCDNLDRERFIDRSECDVQCEDDCYRGVCKCNDVLKHAKKDGSCQYMSGTDLIHWLNYTDADGQRGKGCPYYPDSWYTGDYSDATYDNIFRKKRDVHVDLDHLSWMTKVDEINDDDSIPWNYYEMFEKEHPKENSCDAFPEKCPFTLQYKSTIEGDEEDPLITTEAELRAQIRNNPEFRRTNFFGSHTDCPAGTFFTMDQWETTSNQGFNQPDFNSPAVIAQAATQGGLFERVTEDCAGNPITGLTETNGGWWRPKNPFPGKEQSSYHMIAMSTNLTYAKKYCKQLSGLEAKGMPVGLHCPNSTIENHVLWMSHPDQPLHDFPADTTGIMTGIVRTVNLSAEHYWCDSCRYKQTYFLWRREGGGNSEPTWTARRSLPYFNNPGQKHDDIKCNYQSDGNGCMIDDPLTEGVEDPIVVFENNIFLRYVQPDWSDMHTFNDQSFICEMNCKYYQEPCDPCANVWCPVDQHCVEGECICTDEYAEINIETGECEVNTNTTCPCDEPDCVIDVIIPPDDGEKIKEHGCHCVKLGPLSIVQNYVGGAGKIDEIDAICKRWFDARRCIQLEGGSCFGFDLSTLDYTLVIEGMSHVVSCEQIPNLPGDAATNKCLYDLCLIDTNYALMILYMLEDITEDWTQLVVTEDMCPSCKDWTGSYCIPPTRCEGDAPWVKLIK